ncbi:MAG: MotA/TolQ/ExbB proton channel family protein [Pseudomonadota bacterium]
MASNIAQMIDPDALAIVLAGTVLATVARCGWGDLRVTASELCKLGRTTFNEDANRVALARTVHEIECKGQLGAEVQRPPDASLAKLVDTYLRQGSLDAMHSVRHAERTARDIKRMRAVRVFEYAGELAPVFGLVGTLFAITQLMPGTSRAVEATMGAIATAVLSTLYGVLTAHLICVPLGRAIDRRGEREKLAREQLTEWLCRHLREQPAKLVSSAQPSIRDAA